MRTPSHGWATNAWPRPASAGAGANHIDRGKDLARAPESDEGSEPPAASALIGTGARRVLGSAPGASSPPFMGRLTARSRHSDWARSPAAEARLDLPDCLAA